MKKKILIIAFYYPPDNNGGTERVKQYKKWLTNYGFETYVVTIRCSTDVKNEQDPKVFRYPAVGKLFHFHRGLMRRFAIDVKPITWLATKLLLNRIGKINPDYCIGTFPPYYDFQLGLELKKRYGTKLIADFRDGLLFEPFLDIKEGNQTYKKYLEKLEFDVANNSDLILAAVPQIGDYIEKKYGVSTKTIWNGYDSEENICGAPLKLIGEGKKVLFTGQIDTSRKGTFSEVKSCLEQVFTNNSSITFYFVGNFTDEEVAFFQKYNNVVVHGPVSRSVAVLTQRQADILLLISGNSPYGTGGKLFEYLFSMKPILNIGCNNNACKIIESTNSGATFDTSRTNEINTFLKNAQMKDYQRQGIDIYTRKNEIKELANYINDL